MINMPHPHVNVISEMEDASKLIDIIHESKISYVRSNLSIHLHESQIKLLKNVDKHSKKHHRKVRVRQYDKISDDDKHFKLHAKLFLTLLCKNSPASLSRGMNCTFSGLVSIFFLCGWSDALDRIGRLLVRTLLRTVRVRFQTYGSSRTLSESSVMIFHRFMK